MPAVTTGRRYFLVISLVLLALVFLGFAPTFYLRSFFGKIDRPTGSIGLPGYLVLHGLALTSWFVLFCVQTALINVRQTKVHRKLGLAGAVSALAVITTGVVVLTRVVPRRIQDGVLPPLEGIRAIILFQTFSLALFAGCVAAAIHFRRRPETHKRLMLIASVLLLPAALTPSRDFGAALKSMWPAFVSVEYTTDLVLIASLLVFDLARHRRLLATSIFGAVLLLLVRPLWMSLMLDSDLGIRWTNWLGRIPT